MKLGRLLTVFGTLIMLVGCASTQEKQASTSMVSEFSKEHPNIISAKAQPEVVEVSPDMMPLQVAELVADVKDFQHKVTDVTVTFRDVPLQIAMSPIGATTWRAELTPRQLELLAVNGRTVRYSADVTAKNDAGKQVTSDAPIQVVVKAPDITRPVG